MVIIRQCDSMNKMERYRIHILREIGVPNRHVEELISCFQRHAGPVELIPVNRPVELPRGDNRLILWEDSFHLLREWRDCNSVPEGEFVYALTSSPNEMNWYSASDRERNPRNGFGHVDEYDWVTTAPSWALTSHYLLTAIVTALLQEAGLSAIETVGHKHPRGCFSDFCGDKADFSLKLRTADICGDCLDLFQQKNIPEELIKQIVKIQESIRPLALATSPYLPESKTFAEWPFPVAITRHKASQARLPSQQVNLLIDHFDSLVRYSTIAISAIKGEVIEVIQRPSLGWWLDSLARAVRGTSYRNVVTIAQEENVVHLRNETRGHGWSSPHQSTYEPIAKTLRDTVTRMEDELEPLFLEHKLIIPENITLIDGKYLLSGVILHGSNPLHERFDKAIDSNPTEAGITNTNKIFLSNSQFSDFFSLSPYIRRETCPECHHERILISDGADVYIDTFMGHRATIGS